MVDFLGALMFNDSNQMATIVRKIRYSWPGNRHVKQNARNVLLNHFFVTNNNVFLKLTPVMPFSRKFFVKVIRCKCSSHCHAAMAFSPVIAMSTDH